MKIHAEKDRFPEGNSEMIPLKNRFKARKENLKSIYKNHKKFYIYRFI
jgi:hypothetical protein